MLAKCQCFLDIDLQAITHSENPISRPLMDIFKKLIVISMITYMELLLPVVLSISLCSKESKLILHDHNKTHTILKTQYRTLWHTFINLFLTPKAHCVFLGNFFRFI